jgi:hypothetical protein
MLLRVLRKTLEPIQKVIAEDKGDADWSLKYDQRAVDTMHVCCTVFHLCQKHQIHGTME